MNEHEHQHNRTARKIHEPKNEYADTTKSIIQKVQLREHRKTKRREKKNKETQKKNERRERAEKESEKRREIFLWLHIMNITQHPHANRLERIIFIHFFSKFDARVFSQSLGECEKQSGLSKMYTHTMLWIMRALLSPIHTSSSTRDRAKKKGNTSLLQSTKIEYFPNYIHFCRACHSEETNFHFPYDLFFSSAHFGLTNSSHWERDREKSGRLE